MTLTLLRKCQLEAALAARMAADHWWLESLGMMAECPWLAALSPLIEIGKRASLFRRYPIITTYDHYRRICLQCLPHLVCRTLITNLKFQSGNNI